MANILKTWIESDKREVNRMGKIADKVEAFADTMAKLSDEELQAKTPEFKQRLENGQTLDQVLPEAFAVVREGARRVLRRSARPRIGTGRLHRGHHEPGHP